MIRIVTMAACLLFLTACTNVSDWAALHRVFNGHADADLGYHSFDWHLSGERNVAPLQVFDNGHQTWLQFLPDQFIPAIFYDTPDGEQLLAPVRQGDYLILDGVWPKLSFRGGALRASAQKKLSHDTASLSSDGSEFSEHDEAVAQPVSNENIQKSVKESVYTNGEGTDLVESTTAAVRITHDTGQLTQASFDFGDVAQRRPDNQDNTMPADQSADALYEIRLQDQNLREALRRWAVQARWVFAPEHWDVDVDIPISGEANFQGTFQDAVQDALSATELAERPLRPCFYSNRVLRVVSYAQSCDRSGGVAS